MSLKQEFTLDHRLALVTGGGSGIGAAMVKSLAQAGMSVLLVGRDMQKLELTAAPLRTAYPEASFSCLTLDFALPPNEFSAQLADANFSVTPDLVVHSAGDFLAEDILSTDGASLELLFRVNVVSPLALTQKYVPALTSSGGQLVFVGSSVVQQPAKSKAGAYAMTKYAAQAMVDSLRDALNEQGVRVISCHPGRTATPMQERIFETEERHYSSERLLQPEDVSAAILAALQLPKTAEVTQLAIRPFFKG